MWTSWTEKATKGFTDAFEKTGEAITSATGKAKGTTSTGSDTVETVPSAVTDTEAVGVAEESTSTSSTEQAPAVDTASAVETAGDHPDALPSEQPAATTPKSKMGLGGFHLPSFHMNVNVPNPLKGVSAGVPNVAAAAAENKDKFLNNLQSGWTNVIQSTKRSIDATVIAVEKEQSRLEKSLGLRNNMAGPHKRDPKLPLDVEALRDAEVVYITDRIITMSHPAMASSVDPLITSDRKLAAIGHLLQRRHDGRFLVWNLSEVDYDVSILEDQVMTFSFPGSPSPPLGLMLKLLVSMENWMKADERNVAVVHCLTGRGRTSTVLAAFLCWVGEAGFNDIQQSLAYIARCKQVSPDDLTIPSQRRYASYFKNMLDGVRPSQPPLLLKRIIMSEAPKYAKGPRRDAVDSSSEGGQPINDAETKNDEGSSAAAASSDDKFMGCAPYLQIFKGGQLVFTTAATLHYSQDNEELPFVQVMDGTVPFNVDQIIQGDILIRCRHLTFSKQRVSMFRSAFHTGYVPPNVMRLTKSQLDGACSDKRFPDDFFLDLIFEKVDVETAQKLLEDQQEEADASRELELQEEKIEAGVKKPVVKASSYDGMLHGDTRFWETIAKRRKEQVAQKNDDPMFGPSIGRRRGVSKAKMAVDGAGFNDTNGPPNNELTHMESFSIGNEFDFLPQDIPPTPAPTKAKDQEKDSLMEALMALDEDEGGSTLEDLGTEEIVFDHDAVAPYLKPSTSQPEYANPWSEIPASTPVTGGDEQKNHGVPTPASATDTTTTTPSANAGDGDDAAISDDFDALLASADEDLGDIDLSAFDDDDDMDDLENMLKL